MISINLKQPVSYYILSASELKAKYGPRWKEYVCTGNYLEEYHSIALGSTFQHSSECYPIADNSLLVTAKQYVNGSVVKSIWLFFNPGTYVIQGNEPVEVEPKLFAKLQASLKDILKDP